MENITKLLRRLRDKVYYPFKPRSSKNNIWKRIKKQSKGRK